MNCNQALEALLIAEPSDLAGTGHSLLAEHLRVCARCGAVADQLRCDTDLLTRALAMQEPAPWPRARRRAIRFAVPSAVAAAAVLAIASRGERTGEQFAPAVTSAPADASPVASPASPASIEVAPSSPGPNLRAFAPVVPVTVKRFVPVSLGATPATGAATLAAAVVTVDPPAGQRVAVMRTSNPKLTVVWLY